MNKKLYLQFLLSPVAIFSVFMVLLPQTAPGQTDSAQAQISGEPLHQKLQTIEEKLETRRKELGIPGVALAIVKDNQVIYLKALGYKNFEKNIPATLDTQFSIASCTKAFTALSVLMSQDNGKLFIEDNPKKYLSYFKINDPEIDSKITIRNLLSHTSGLNRMDLAMVSGKLNREELIRLMSEAKPASKLGERYQYNNLNYTAAGKIVSKTQKMAWEKFVEERIFKPLGMTNTNLSVKQMQRAKDYSFGYEYNSNTKETINVPARLGKDAAAPAGSINSSVRDMAKWLQFMLGGGVFNGKRLISESAFTELTKPQMKISRTYSYGFGWFLSEWRGLKFVEHGGNSRGFNASVAMIPEKKIGFAILTNVSGSPLPDEMAEVIWSNLIDTPATPAASNTGNTNTAPVSSTKEPIVNSPAITPEELMLRVIAALGGEANWRKIKTRISTYDLNYVNQGVKGSGTFYAKAPNMIASKFTLRALGKPIADAFEYFNGVEGSEWYTFFAAPKKYAGRQLENVRIGADFYGWLNWKTNYKTVTVKGIGKVGDEEAFVVVFEPEKGSKATVYFSTKTFLPLKREAGDYSPAKPVNKPHRTYGDYREVDGIKIPFRIVYWDDVEGDGDGEIVTTLKEVKHNTEIPDNVFRLTLTKK